MEKEFWEARYKKEGIVFRDADGSRIDTSGRGSIGIVRAWKWKIIGEMIRKYSPELIKPDSKQIQSKIIDVGCGDLSFWDDESHTILVEEYTGIDFCDTVIMENRGQDVKGWNFIASPAQILMDGLKAPVVLCMDLLFHVMDDMGFIKTLKNLCYYSEDLILIHTWKYNPFKDMPPEKETGEGIYMKYRPLEAYFGIFMGRGFMLMEEILNPNKVGVLYVFKRV